MKRTEHTQKWLDALRSGKYAQTRGTLTDGNGYCCLGVAGNVIGVADTSLLSNDKAAYVHIGKTMGISTHERGVCIDMNDAQRKSFPEIADAIEAMIE